MSTIKELFMKPEIANLVLVLFLFGAFYYLHKQNALDKFLRFGPNKEKPAEFIGMKIDNWERCLMVMITSFVISLISNYVETVNKDKWQRFLNQDSLKDPIQMSKSVAQLIVFITPILFRLLDILKFFLNTTFEIQYIIPNLIGKMLIEVPYSFYKISQQKFD